MRLSIELLVMTVLLLAAATVYGDLHQELERTQFMLKYAHDQQDLRRDGLLEAVEARKSAEALLESCVVDLERWTR